MSSQPMLSPELTELEAEFLSSPSDSWPRLQDGGPTSVELPRTVALVGDDGPEYAMTKIRTTTGCCR